MWMTRDWLRNRMYWMCMYDCVFGCRDFGRIHRSYQCYYIRPYWKIKVTVLPSSPFLSYLLSVLGAFRGFAPPNAKSPLSRGATPRHLHQTCSSEHATFFLRMAYELFEWAVSTMFQNDRSLVKEPRTFVVSFEV